MKKMFFVFVMLFLSQYVKSADISNFSQGTPPQGMRGKPINLPDVSALVNIVGYTSDDKKDEGRNDLYINEVETAFQGYIYPEMRADIILAIHKHGDEYETEICEAKASFLNLGYGFSAEIGKVHIDFGKLNKLHTHHLPTTDRPFVLEKFLGEHELGGQGMTLKYLIPVLPFYSQLQAGFWKINAHHHDEEDHHDSSFSPADKVYTARWNSSFEIGSQKELEVGFSGLKGRGPHYKHPEENMRFNDNVEIVGLDITFKWFPSSYKKLTFQNEWLHLRREVPTGKINRDGFYSFINYRANKYFDYGLRFDYSENAFPDISYERAFSAIITGHLTETSFWRLTGKHRNINGKKVTEAWIQLSFGIGPHSHELE
ncbi:MAG: hypothetical protein K6357_08350 [Elusimicrobiota bacterium]